MLQVAGLELAARTGRRPVGGHLLLLQSFFLVAAGNETPEAGLAPAWAGLSVTLSPVDIRVARVRNAPGAEAAGNETPDADLAPAAEYGSDLLRPDLEAGQEDPEPGKRGLGCQPVTPLGRATRPATGPAGQASG